MLWYFDTCYMVDFLNGDMIWYYDISIYLIVTFYLRNCVRNSLKNLELQKFNWQFRFHYNASSLIFWIGANSYSTFTCQLVLDKQFGLGFSPNLESNAFCPLFMTTSQQPDPAHDMRPDLALFCSEIDAYRELGIFFTSYKDRGIIMCKPG